MQSRKSRLDRFISQQTPFSRSAVRQLIAQNRIKVDGQPASGISQVIGQFSHIELDGESLQDNQAVYIMLNKPVGTVSATRDDQHKTVIDLLAPEFQKLHIAGRLDLNSSGLLLLTNDGEWSRNIASPQKKIAKRYQVRVANPITDEYAPAFAAGMYFPYEGITTRPAILEKTSEYEAEITLFEGKYHQIKRMFGRFRNPVVKLHRISIGPVQLDTELSPGESRALSNEEVSFLQA